MLPKNRLGRAMIKKLHVVEGAEHPHQAQQPVAVHAGAAARVGGPPGAGPAPRAQESAKADGLGGDRAGHEADRDGHACPATGRRPRRRSRRPRRRPTAKKTAAKTTTDEADAQKTARRPRRRPRPPVKGRTRKWPRPPPSSRPDDARRRWPAFAWRRARGQFDINGRTLEDYFPTRVHRMIAASPLKLRGARQGLRCDRDPQRRRRQRPGGRAALGDRPGADRARPRARGAS